jgi:hypothetical protein
LYQTLIPPDASAAEKQLFSIDLEIVAALTYRDLQQGLQQEHAGATLFERPRILSKWRTSAAWGS